MSIPPSVHVTVSHYFGVNPFFPSPGDVFFERYLIKFFLSLISSGQLKISIGIVVRYFINRPASQCLIRSYLKNKTKKKLHHFETYSHMHFFPYGFAEIIIFLLLQRNHIPIHKSKKDAEAVSEMNFTQKHLRCSHFVSKTEARAGKYSIQAANLMEHL